MPGIAGSAATGAAAGSVLGPIGTAAGAVGGAIYGAISTKVRNKRQFEEQKQLYDIQARHNEDLAKFNQDLATDTWKQTGPVGQMEQLNKAGLNPALIYGDASGGGGTTGNVQAGATGTASAPGYGDASAYTGMGIQLATQLKLLQAQKENIEANTQKTIAETPGEGQTQAKIATEIGSLTQGIQSDKAKQALTEVQTQISQIELQIKTETKEDVSQQITDAARKTNEELQILQNQNTITTYEAQNAQATANENLIALQLKNDNMRKQLNLTDEQIKQIANSIKNDNTRVAIEQKVKDITGSEELVGKIIGNIMGILTHGIIK